MVVLVGLPWPVCSDKKSCLISIVSYQRSDMVPGGLSFFSSREGFISDNVVNFEVVLA